MLSYEPVCSICVSTWNRLDDLKRCINSILSQTYPYIEIVIVDNCSVDGTHEWCCELIHECRFPVIYHQMPHDKHTAMTTLNLAFELANGEYICVVDDDAWLDDNCVELLVNTILSDRNIVIVGANVKGLNDETQMTIRDSFGNKIDLPSTITYFDFKGACALLNKKYISGLGYYDETFNIYMNELDLSLKCIKSGKMVVLNGKAIAYHGGGVDIGNPAKYISNYHEVVYKNFTFINAVKMMVLNYFTISYLKGRWLRNAWITLIYLMRLCFRFNVKCCPGYIQRSLINGLINSIKGEVDKRI